MARRRIGRHLQVLGHRRRIAGLRPGRRRSRGGRPARSRRSRRAARAAPRPPGDWDAAPGRGGTPATAWSRSPLSAAATPWWKVSSTCRSCSSRRSRASWMRRDASSWSISIRKIRDQQSIASWNRSASKARWPSARSCAMRSPPAALGGLGGHAVELRPQLEQLGRVRIERARHVEQAAGGLDLTGVERAPRAGEKRGRFRQRAVALSSAPVACQASDSASGPMIDLVGVLLGSLSAIIRCSSSVLRRTVLSTSGGGCGRVGQEVGGVVDRSVAVVEPLLQPFRRREQRVEAQDEVAAEQRLLAACLPRRASPSGRRCERPGSGCPGRVTGHRDKSLAAC